MNFSFFLTVLSGQIKLLYDAIFSDKKCKTIKDTLVVKHLSILENYEIFLICIYIFPESFANCQALSLSLLSFFERELTL